MQARKLKKILNNTEYIVHNQKNQICVGSRYIPDLISINKKTLVLKSTIDVSNDGNLRTHHAELSFIWNKLQELIKSGEIKEIIEKDDVLENPFPVFTIDNGELIETFTDQYGFPNVTISGKIMYDNTHFKTRKEAIEYGINDAKIGIKWAKEAIERSEKQIQKERENLKKEKETLNGFLSLLKQ